MLKISSLDKQLSTDDVSKVQAEEIENQNSDLLKKNLDENKKLSLPFQLSSSTNSLFQKYLPKRRLGHRRVNEFGQVSFKKIETSQLCASLQMGICFSVSRLTSKPERDVLMNDFTITEITSFPSSGSNITPAHKFDDFKFKAYAPVAFRYFRDLFGIAPENYLISVGHEPLRELSNPGASGSVFYKTKDDRFIIKTVQQKESNFLRKLLPKYFMNLHQNPDTLLPKFYGLYCCICGTNRVRVVVMNNLLPSKLPIHLKFDLKGSSYKRKAKKHELIKSCPTYKDLDFVEIHSKGIILESDTYDSLIKTIKRDCTVLQSFNIMDYSFLIGIHNFTYQDKLNKENGEEKNDSLNLDKNKNENGNENENENGNENENKNKNKNESENENNVLNNNTKIQNEIKEFDEDSVFLDDQDKNIYIGNDLQLDFLDRHNRYSQNYYLPPDVITAKTADGDNILIFCGIIDILQSYEIGKIIEHSLKSIITDGKSISVTKPDFYAIRFQDFLANQVFKVNKETPQKINQPFLNPYYNYIKRKIHNPLLNSHFINFTNSQLFNQSIFSNSTETMENQSLYSYKTSIKSAPSYNRFNKALQEELYNRTNNLILHKKITKDKLLSRNEYLKSINNSLVDEKPPIFSKPSENYYAKYKNSLKSNIRRLSEKDETDLMQ